MIFLDPHEPDPTKKYKLFHLEFSEPFDPAKHGVFASYSADGVNFTGSAGCSRSSPTTRRSSTGTNGSRST